MECRLRRGGPSPRESFGWILGIVSRLWDGDNVGDTESVERFLLDLVEHNRDQEGLDIDD